MARFSSYEDFWKAHKDLVEEALANGSNFRQRQSHWTESIAVGGNKFTKKIKEKLGILAKGRKILEIEEGFYLREEFGTYIAHFDNKMAT